MNHDSYANDYILGILGRVRTIAMVGASDLWSRPSYFAMKYLQNKGYRVLPVNPGRVGSVILGEQVYGSLKELPSPVDMVDVFRATQFAGAVTDEAIAVAADTGISVVWMQIGVRDDAAAKRAEKAGLAVVMNRCPKIEYGRLHRELGWGGFDTHVIDSRRTRLRFAETKS